MIRSLSVSIIGLIVLLAKPAHCVAAQVDTTDWQVNYISQEPPRPASNLRPGSLPTALPPVNYLPVYDKRPDTSIILTNLASSTKSPSLLIDLAQLTSVHRVVIASTNNQFQFWPDSSGAAHVLPRGLVVVFVGSTPRTLTNVGSYAIPYNAGNVISQPIDIRFNPIAGRYIRLELQTRVNWTSGTYANNIPFGWTNAIPSADQMWQIGEVEVFGTTTTTATNAVVLNSSAYALKLAANDLSYYLTELTGQPHPVISPAQTNLYPGKLYVIDDLAALAPNYATMMANIANGSLSTNEVNVLQNGRVIKFTGWPYRVVCWSVWEFLERQGVRWVYPDVHGDYVPQKTSVDLSFLPLRLTNYVKTIYANFDTGSFRPWPAWVAQSDQQGWLYWWRNHWSSSSSPSPWGAEIPYIQSSGTVDPQYAEGFDGYPHNLTTVVPSRVLANNSSWWGTADGVNFTPNGVQFDLASTGAAQWIAKKVIAWDAVHHGPQQSVQSLGINYFETPYNLLPVDAATFSIDSETVAANNLYNRPPSWLPWIWTWKPSSGAYYKLLSTVASIATNQIIGGLAYADVYDPPKSNYPPNVQMEFVMYGSPNLPITAAPNAAMKQAVDGWHQVCSRLAHYDYALLISDVWQGDNRIPVPMVHGMVDTAKYLFGIGAQNGGTQATEAAIQYNPWDFFAWPRIRWNTNLTSDQILDDFFTGYYREASVPMRAYYKAMEDYQYSNSVDMHFHGYCYNLMPGAFPVGVLNAMRTNLAAAQTLATNWYIINRINDATNSFGWTMNRLGLTEDSLTNLSRYASVPTTGVYSCNLSNFKQYTLFGAPYYSPVWNEDGNRAWNFDGAAIIYQTLNFTSGGTYRVKVTNWCKWSNGSNYPTLRVILGPSASATAGSALTVNWGAQQDSTFDLTVPSGGLFDLFIAQDKSGQLLGVQNVTLTKL